MKYDKIVEGIFVERPNRFIAKVMIDGKEETVHVKNTGLSFYFKKYLLEKPLKADIALIYADKADKYGNLGYFGTTRNFNTVMALAASTVIVEAEEYIDGALDPNDIVVPGVLVDHVVVKGA